MKKKSKNILIVCLAMLLSGGIAAYYMARHKAKEKEKIVRTLEDVMIPDAERVRDSLINKRDEEAIKYADVLKSLDSLRYFQDSLQNVFDNKYFNKVKESVDELASVFHKNPHKELRLRNNYKICVPGHFEVYYDSEDLDMLGVWHEPGIGEWGDLEICTNYSSIYLYYVSSASIPSTVSTVYVEWGDGTSERCLGDSSPRYKITILKSIQDFVAHVDNSKNVVDNNALYGLNIAAGKSIETLRAKIELDSGVSKLVAQKNQMEKEMAKINNLISEQEARILELKSPTMVEKMYRSRSKANGS